MNAMTHGHSRHVARLGTILLVLTAIGAAGPVLANTDKVNCGKGESLAKALAKANPGDTIKVTGVCQERVTITTDQLTLDGQGSAVIDGGGGGPAEFSGVVTIDGVHGVTITGFVIRNGPGEGILGRRGAAFAVQSTTVRNNSLTGIAVDSSRAELTDVTLQGNVTGLDVFTSSSAILRGSIAINNNAGNGAEVNGESVLEIRGAHVQANHNGGVGVVAGSGQIALFGLSSSDGSTLTATNNGFAGVVLGGSQMTAYANCTITASNNSVGMFLGGGASIVSPNGGAQFVIENNGVGMQVQTGSGALFLGGPLIVRNNAGAGVLGNGAGVITIVSDPPGASVIKNNGTDVDLKFGTRSELQGVTIGTITCDKTVLSRGSTVCP